jgi:hypothetical protein
MDIDSIVRARWLFGAGLLSLACSGQQVMTTAPAGSTVTVQRNGKVCVKSAAGTVAEEGAEASASSSATLDTLLFRACEMSANGVLPDDAYLARFDKALDAHSSEKQRATQNEAIAKALDAVAESLSDANTRAGEIGNAVRDLEEALKDLPAKLRTLKPGGNEETKELETLKAILERIKASSTRAVDAAGQGNRNITRARNDLEQAHK